MKKTQEQKRMDMINAIEEFEKATASIVKMLCQLDGSKNVDDMNLINKFNQHSPMIMGFVNNKPQDFEIDFHDLAHDSIFWSQQIKKQLFKTK